MSQQVNSDAAAPLVPDVVALGECLVAFQASETGPLAGCSSFDAHLAGAEANVCVGLARLGHQAAFLGRVGADPLGERLLRQLRMEGVDIRGVTVDPDAPTGIQVRERRGFGRSEFVYYRSGSAGSRVTADEVLAQAPLIAGASWLHLTGITPALSPGARDATLAATEIAASAGTRISIDLNVRLRLWPGPAEAKAGLAALAGVADLLLAGEAEAALVVGPGSREQLGERLRSLARPGATVVVKLGADGALAFPAEGGVQHAPAPPVPDTTDVVGAGDAFAAGCLSALLDGGLGPLEALARGNTCAAYAISARGDTTGLPRRHELADGAVSLADVLR